MYERRATSVISLPPLVVPSFCVGAVFTSRCTEPETLDYKLTRLKMEHLLILLVCGCTVFVFCTPECVHTLSREC